MCVLVMTSKPDSLPTASFLTRWTCLTAYLMSRLDLTGMVGEWTDQSRIEEAKTIDSSLP